MSRYCSWKDIEPQLNAANVWKEECLLGGGSLFCDQDLWIPQYFQELEEYFLNNPDEGNESFLDKLTTQLEPVSDGAKKLAAECLWILFLYTHKNVGPSRKREIIKTAWEWSNNPLNMNHPLLSDDVLLGVGSSGTGFNTHQPFELQFCITMARDFILLEESKQRSLLSEPWLFSEWLNSIEGIQNRQFRHMVCFFLFPDAFEATCVRGHKLAILQHLGSYSKSELRSMESDAIDKALFDLRPQMAKEIGRSEFTYYDADVQPKWSKASSKEDVVKEADVKYATNNENPTQEITSTQNLILYGPPGTGKTYNSINHAVALCRGIPVSQVIAQDQGDHESVKAEFDSLVKSGQIVFTTFHQSMAYEDFVEGIKPRENEDGGIRYDVVDGIFKEVCKQASVKAAVEGSSEPISFEGRRFWKMSLGNTLIAEDDEIYSECINNNYALLGYGWGLDYSNCKNVDEIFAIQKKHEISSKKRDYEVSSVNTFIHRMNVGDVVIISDGNHKFRAIGEVVGDYELLNGIDRDHFRQKRAVKWLRSYKPSVPASTIFQRNISQQTIYELNRHALDLDALKELIAEELPSTSGSGEIKPHVLIIDEINRGNVSAILGELITLLEPDKRLGAENELRVTLPYSQDSNFGVPPNLHIIGTMNTADRSVEALDTALRRRFTFEEMMPIPELLNTVEEVDLIKMLMAINQRLEVLVGRDHTIGHAFFMQVKDLESLQSVFHSKVIPQLQEYFYGDWEKIHWVLGKNFVTRDTQAEKVSWPNGGSRPDELDGRNLWRITKSDTSEGWPGWNAAAFRSIYSNDPETNG